MRQHYELGQFLRNRYTGFLNESYNRHEVNGLSCPLSDHMILHRQTMIHINIEEKGGLFPLTILVLYRVPTGAGIPRP